MYKKNEARGFQLQEQQNLTRAGWLVWLLCLALSTSGSLAFLSWAKAGFEWQMPSLSSLFPRNN